MFTLTNSADTAVSHWGLRCLYMFLFRMHQACSTSAYVECETSYTPDVDSDQQKKGKIVINFLSICLNICFGCSKVETVLLSIHYIPICLGWEIRKLFTATHSYLVLLEWMLGSLLKKLTYSTKLTHPLLLAHTQTCAIFLLIKVHNVEENSVDQDQLASSEASWSWSTTVLRGLFKYDCK